MLCCEQMHFVVPKRLWHTLIWLLVCVRAKRHTHTQTHSIYILYLTLHYIRLLSHDSCLIVYWNVFIILIAICLCHVLIRDRIHCDEHNMFACVCLRYASMLCEILMIHWQGDQETVVVAFDSKPEGTGFDPPCLPQSTCRHRLVRRTWNPAGPVAKLRINVSAEV